MTTATVTKVKNDAREMRCMMTPVYYEFVRV